MLTFAEPKEIRLRDYQADAIDALRQKIRAGSRRLILCAGTGAGKTLTSASLLREADRKGSFALFIVDRVALVEQTSEVFSEYGIRHGVIQGIHKRWAPRENVQVCSAQTLARRGLLREPDLIVVDEAHCFYKATLDLMERYPRAVKIGLTATPFTKGMGLHWDDMVNVIPTRRLIDEGYLVEPKIYVAKSPGDEEFTRNSFGEFSDESAASAGIKIVGDVVQEWIAKTHEHFGGPVKTIVFSPTVEHGRELCAAFAAAGYNFQQISYLDRDDDERLAKIGEFRRPDSMIHGLVSCGVLTKGFDVPDVRCIAEGSLVLTDKGLVPIESVTLGHRLWDGIEFVEHQGVVFKGYRDVIEYAGLTATPDHEVHTAQGWRTLGDCAAEQVGITQTGFGRRPVRSDAGYFARGSLEKAGAVGPRSRPLPLHWLWPRVCARLGQTAGRSAHSRVSAMLPERRCGGARGTGAGMAGAAREGHEGALRQPLSRRLPGLRSAWDRVSVFLGSSLRGMGAGQPRLAVAGPEHSVGPHQQRRSLRARQSALGVQGAQLQQHAPWWVGGQDAPLQDGASRGALRRQDAPKPLRGGPDLQAGGGEILPAVGQAKRPVWDILQAGPRNRFTCEGLLVHNCGVSCKPYRKSLSSHMQEIGRVMRPIPGEQKTALWLDHSGNIERFAVDMFDVWENGAGELDKAEKRDSTPRERSQQVREKVVCPECAGALRGNTCMACGWERPPRSNIHAVEGELREFDPAALGMTPRAGLRAECLKDPRAVYNACVYYAIANCRDGDCDKSRKRAFAIWCGIYPGVKARPGWYGMRPTAPSADALALIEREVARFRKHSRMRRAA